MQILLLYVTFVRNKAMDDRLISIFDDKQY